MEVRNRKEGGVDTNDIPDGCSVQLTKLITHVAIHVAGFFLMYILCHLSHYLLKPYSQPRITSDTFVSLSPFLLFFPYFLRLAISNFLLNIRQAPLLLIIGTQHCNLNRL